MFSKFKLPSSCEKTLAYSMTALILYFPANLFPFMKIDMYGKVSSPTIWGGIVSLAKSGDMFIAIVVFLASFLFPFVKILILFYLSLNSSDASKSKLNQSLYQFVEAVGRWSMLDIFLMAILITVMKMRAMSSVEPGLGAILFVFVVIFTMLASASFSMDLIPKEEHARIKQRSL